MKEGEEPADAIFQALQSLGVPFSYRRKVMDAAKSDGMSDTRAYRLAFSRTVRMEDSSFQSDLRIYDEGKEPVDVIYLFALLNSAMEYFDLMSVLVLPHINDFLHCQRLVPLVFRKVLSDKDRTALRRVYIIRDEESIDVIDRFIQAYGLAYVYEKKAYL